MKDKILNELKFFLTNSLEHIYLGNITMNKEEVTKKIALFITGRSHFSKERLHKQTIIGWNCERTVPSPKSPLM